MKSAVALKQSEFSWRETPEIPLKTLSGPIKYHKVFICTLKNSKKSEIYFHKKNQKIFWKPRESFPQKKFTKIYKKSKKKIPQTPPPFYWQKAKNKSPQILKKSPFF